MTTSGTGSWNAPSLFYMEKPDGTLVAVSESGGPLPNPPDLNAVSAESLGYSSAVGSVVIDQWGRVIVPFYPPGSFGSAPGGGSISEALNPHVLNAAPWPPTEWPPESGSLPSSIPLVYNDPYGPDDVKYWIDPDSGQVALVVGDSRILTNGPMIQQIGGKVVDQWGNEIEPLWPPGDLGIDEKGSPTDSPTLPEGAELRRDVGPHPVFTPPAMSYWQDPTTGKYVAVDETGTPLVAPPEIVVYGGKVVDPWGNEIEPFWPPGDLSIDEKGSPTDPPTLPEGFTPPAMSYWQDPTTGKYVAVDETGTPLVSPPEIVVYGGKVVDPWGNEIQPLWPPGDLGIDEKGSPTDSPPPNTMLEPPAMSYWQDPTTGKYVAVDETGTPLVSPPEIVVYGGKVVDPWGNEIQPLWPPGDLSIDEKGSPTDPPTLPEGFSSPVASYWEDPDTGKLVALNEYGYQLTSPPLLTKLSGDARDALGYPPGEYELVVDQWGNPVIPINPPGSFGVDETGSPLAGAGTVPPWPPEEWPPGSGPDETVDIEDSEMKIPLEDLEAGTNVDPTADPGTMTAPPEEVTEAAPDMEETSTSLDEGAFDPAERYSGIEQAAGPVALDDDLNETSEESLITAGLDESVPRDVATGRGADVSEPSTVELAEELLVDGLDSPEYKLDKVEEAAFKVEEPAGVVGSVIEFEELESVDDFVDAPLPTVEPVTEADMKLIEPIETVDFLKAIESEESAIEPIEIVVETLDPEIGGRVSEPEEIPDRFAATEEDYDDEEEEPQP